MLQNLHILSSLQSIFCILLIIDHQNILICIHIHFILLIFLKDLNKSCIKLLNSSMFYSYNDIFDTLNLSYNIHLHINTFLMGFMYHMSCNLAYIIYIHLLFQQNFLYMHKYYSIVFYFNLQNN